jgi:hypothetical protein
MKNRWAVCLVLMVAFASCAPPQKGQDTEIVAIPKDDLTVPGPTECTETTLSFDQYKASPRGGIVDPSPPLTFSWALDCIPENYYFKLTPYKENQTILISENISGENSEYTSNIQLELVTSYEWYVRADALGGLINVDSSWFFSTGPVCSEQDLIPPTLISPVNGAFDGGKGYGSLDEVILSVGYPAGNCTPEWFPIELSLNADLSGDTKWLASGPGNIGAEENGMRIMSTQTWPLLDCSIYYWRSRSEANGFQSDWSETNTFFTNFYNNCFVVSEFKGINNANCRNGPWVGENYVGIIRENETAMLLGLNEDATWGMFKLKNELECWVAMSLVEPVPPYAVFFPGFYPVLEHTEKPKDTTVPAEEPVPAEDPEPALQQGCMVPVASGRLACQIPCPDPKYAAIVCP